MTEQTDLTARCAAIIHNRYGYLADGSGSAQGLASGESQSPDFKAQLIKESRKGKNPEVIALIAVGNWEQFIVNNALRNPRFPIEVMHEFLYAYSADAKWDKFNYNDASKYHHRYEAIIQNKSIPSDLLMQYLGEMTGIGVFRWPSKLRLKGVLAHPNVPEDFLIKLINGSISSLPTSFPGNEDVAFKSECLEVIAKNKAISDTVARMIARGGEKFITTRALINLVRNPGVSQAVIRSLLPNTEGRLADGKVAPVSLLQALVTNLTNLSERQYVLNLLSEKSTSHSSNYLIACFSENEDSLYQVAYLSKNRSVAMKAASRMPDPEPIQVLVNLRNLEDKSYGLELRVPAVSK